MKTVMVGSGGKTVEAGRATSLSPRYNLVAQKQRLNLRCLAFLSLLLLHSIASAQVSFEDLLHSIASAQVSFEDRCDDRGECQCIASDLRKNENITGRHVRKRENEESFLIKFNFSRHLSYVVDQDFRLDADRLDYGSVPNQEFGRDTNRLDYFRVTALDVHGDNDLTGNTSYGDGGGRRDHSVVVDQRLGQERVDAPTNADGSDMTTQVPVGIFDDNGGDDSETLLQMLEQNSGSDGGEAVVQGLEHETDDGGGGVCDGEDGGDLVVIGWWEKWWVWLALWKIV